MKLEGIIKPRKDLRLMTVNQLVEYMMTNMLRINEDIEESCKPIFDRSGLFTALTP